LIDLSAANGSFCSQSPMELVQLLSLYVYSDMLFAVVIPHW